MRDWDELSELEHSKYENFLDSALIFSGSSRAEYLALDLRTYRSDDDSYDIFLLCINHSSIFLVGRDFFQFALDFCLGSEALKRLSDYEVIHEKSLSNSPVREIVIP